MPQILTIFVVIGCLFFSTPTDAQVDDRGFSRYDVIFALPLERTREDYESYVRFITLVSTELHKLHQTNRHALAVLPSGMEDTACKNHVMPEILVSWKLYDEIEELTSFVKSDFPLLLNTRQIDSTSIDGTIYNLGISPLAGPHDLYTKRIFLLMHHDWDHKEYAYECSGKDVLNSGIYHEKSLHLPLSFQRVVDATKYKPEYIHFFVFPYKSERSVSYLYDMNERCVEFVRRGVQCNFSSVPTEEEMDSSLKRLLFDLKTHINFYPGYETTRIPVSRTESTMEAESSESSAKDPSESSSEGTSESSSEGTSESSSENSSGSDSGGGRADPDSEDTENDDTIQETQKLGVWWIILIITLSLIIILAIFLVIMYKRLNFIRGTDATARDVVVEETRLLEAPIGNDIEDREVIAVTHVLI